MRGEVSSVAGSKKNKKQGEAGTTNFDETGCFMSVTGNG